MCLSFFDNLEPPVPPTPYPPHRRESVCVPYPCGHPDFKPLAGTYKIWFSVVSWRHVRARFNFEIHILKLCSCTKGAQSLHTLPQIMHALFLCENSTRLHVLSSRTQTTQADRTWISFSHLSSKKHMHCVQHIREVVFFFYPPPFLWFLVRHVFFLPFHSDFTKVTKCSWKDLLVIVIFLMLPCRKNEHDYEGLNK